MQSVKTTWELLVNIYKTMGAARKFSQTNFEHVHLCNQTTPCRWPCRKAGSDAEIENWPKVFQLQFHRGHAGERLWLETPLKRTRDGRGNSRWHWWIEWCGGLARAHIKAVGCIGVESWVTGNRAAGRWITEGKTKQGWFSWRYAQRTARENSQSDEH